MKLASLDDLLLHELRDLYSAEHQVTRALPALAKAASSPALKRAFHEHLEVTLAQIERLDKIFASLKQSSRGETCAAMAGLIKEWEALFMEEADPAVMDAALIAAAQRVEHYEMAGYGCARTFARQLGHEQIAQMLQVTLDEEAEADESLTALAESEINAQAIRASDDREIQG